MKRTAAHLQRRVGHLRDAAQSVSGRPRDSLRRAGWRAGDAEGDGVEAAAGVW